MFCQFPRKLVGKERVAVAQMQCKEMSGCPHSSQALTLSGITHALINCVISGSSHNLSGYQLPYFDNRNIHSCPTAYMVALASEMA